VTQHRAIILAAGLGSRLGALSDERPKPLLPVCDIPLIRFALAHLVGHGITDVAINLFHRGDLIEAALGDGSAYGAKLVYSHEEILLGTGGGLRRMGDWLTDGGKQSFVVMNGKILIDVDLQALVAQHHRDDDAATMVVRQVPDAQRWGAIHVDGNRITGILDRGQPALATMFTGVHVIAPRLLDRLPAQGESDSIRQAYLPALSDGDRLGAVVYDGYFQEHSTPHRYLEGNWNALSGKASLTHPPGPLVGIDVTAKIDGTVDELVRIGPNAVVERGASVGPLCVVGSNAVVAAGASLKRVVVWPGARAEGHLSDVIVTPHAVVSGARGAKD